MRPEDAFPLLVDAVRRAERRAVPGDGGKPPYQYDVFSFGERGTRISAGLIREIRLGLVSHVTPYLAECDCIVAPNPGGHRWALLVADAVSRPLVVIRSNESEEQQFLELEGQRAVMIDDVVSRGASATWLVDTVNRIGGRVVAIVAIVVKGRDQAALNRHRHIPVRSLLRLDQDQLCVDE
jgi:orotate phosphoribosyltransferase